jgi:hypothetical protein
VKALSEVERAAGRPEEEYREDDDRDASGDAVPPLVFESKPSTRPDERLFRKDSADRPLFGL